MSAPQLAEHAGLARRVPGVLATFALYAGLVVWLTWPLVPHLGTRLPDTAWASRFDPLYMGWLLAHESRALLAAPGTFRDTNIFHPARDTLFYGDTGFGALPYFLPVFALTGNPTLALNLVFLGCIALTATTLHLVVARWTGSQLGGFVGAWTLLTTRWVLWEFIPAAPSYAVLQYLPLIVFLAAPPAARWGTALRLLPLVVLQCLTDVLYVAAAVMVPLGVLALGRLARRETRAAGLRLLAVLALALLVLAPVYAGHRAVHAANPGLRFQTPWFWRFSVIRTSLPWGPLSPQAATGVPLAALLLTAVGAVSFALGARRGRGDRARSAWAHGALWAVVGLLMSITPIADLHGREVRLPHALLARWFPIYQTLRVPARLGLASLVGLAILAGVAFAECTRWLSGSRGPQWLARAVRGGLALLVAAAMYVQYADGVGAPAGLGMAPLPRTYPLAEAVTPASPLLGILRQPGGPLLELPAVAFEQHARAMYRSIFHGRRLVNGYNSYFPAGFRERMALAKRLPDPEALAALRRETGLDWILVHVADIGRYERELCEIVHRARRAERCGERIGASERAAWLALAESGGRDDLRLIARDGDDQLFAVGGEDQPAARRPGAGTQ